MASSLIDNIASEVMDNFGDSVFGSALSNLFNGQIGEAFKSMIDSLPMPDFMKDIAKGVIDDVVGEAHQDGVPEEAQRMVDEGLGEMATESAQSAADEIMENIMQMASEETREAGGAGGGAGGAGGANNWFYLLAKAMGEVSGQHLQTMINKAQEMSSLTGEDQAAELAVVQAEMQAAAQQFKMASESSSTVIKSIGEGMSAVARKQ